MPCQYLIPKHEIGYNIKNGEKLFLIAELSVLKIQFSHILFEAWYSLDPTIINLKSLEFFKSKLLGFN